MPARTGEQFLRGLKDEREIWIGNEKVCDVPSHPAFAGAAKGLAAVFDLQHRHAAECLVPDPETGEPINVSHLIPRSKEDIQRRHRGLERMAEHTVGVMGRTPDYMNVTYAGFAGRSDEWGANGNEAGAERLVKYQKFLRRNDISLTHTIINPTIDKAKGDTPAPGDDVALHKVGESEHGIIVRGARILATLAPFADELAVYPAHPLVPGADAYALSFCIPMATPGLKFISRDSCAAPTQNAFDHPLSSRYDEQDAFVIFDDVEVPWDRVFIDSNVPVYNQVMSTGWFPNVMQQTMIRAQAKLEFAWGLATRMLESINALQPPNVQMLGEMWTYAEFARACIQCAEENAYEFGNGVWFPQGAPLTALRANLPAWFPRVNEIIRLLGSHNLLAAPTYAQLSDPELRPLIERYMRGAGNVSAEERARVFRLAWDFTGSALASRGEQYERFYLASGARNQQVAHRTADRARADRLVDRFLKEPVQ
ncbi:MAG: 4-hydroxyphenylacetate 3-hydroxylase [Alphaproteobacteria bacterium]|nr:4-hydroxyphenylacetate 3-hydroxylase [Alphaproteobacteria bacterium]